jgi:uncharacterized protein
VTTLLDVNVLIALIDPAHIHHNAAHRWFAGSAHAGWATCPLVENGVLRIVGNPAYPNSPGSPAVVAPILRALRVSPGYVHWPDSLSLLDAAQVDMSRLLRAAEITDVYLLALAVSRGGRLATFDRKLMTTAVTNGREALCPVPIEA